jgi:hypothetical protein
VIDIVEQTPVMCVLQPADTMYSQTVMDEVPVVEIRHKGEKHARVNTWALLKPSLVVFGLQSQQDNKAPR